MEAGSEQNQPSSDGIVSVAGRTYATQAYLADLFGVTPRTLARWDDQRIGPPKSKVGKLILYDFEKLPGWLESHETVSRRSRR